MNLMFSTRLRALREKMGITQSFLASHLHKAESTVRMWELGKNEPDHQTLVELSYYFRVSTDYLLGKTDDPTPPLKLEGTYLRMAQDAQDKQMSPAFIKKMFALYEEFQELNKDEQK